MIKEGYTRVSEIIGWYKSLLLGQIDQEVLNKKRDIGSEVHEAIDGYYTGAFVPLGERSQPYFESFKKWAQASSYKIHCQEERFYCDELLITGAVDMIADDDGKAVLIDFKTSLTADKKGWVIQGAFYDYLSPMKIDRIEFIKLDKEGKIPKVITYQPSPELWEQALQSYRVYKFWND